MHGDILHPYLHRVNPSLRQCVRAVTRACEGRLRSMQLELSEARLQRDEAEMRQQEQQEQEQQEQDTPPESGDADLLKLQVEQLTAQLAAQTQRADAAEEEVAMWQRAE